MTNGQAEPAKKYPQVSAMLKQGDIEPLLHHSILSLRAFDAVSEMIFFAFSRLNINFDLHSLLYVQVFKSCLQRNLKEKLIWATLMHFKMRSREAYWCIWNPSKII